MEQGSKEESHARTHEDCFNIDPRASGDFRGIVNRADVM